MTGRLLWFAAGAGSAVWLGVRGRRAAYRLTPEGIVDQVGAARLGLRSMAAEFTAGAAAQEEILLDRLGLVDQGRRPASADAARIGSAARASEAAGVRPRLVAAPDPDIP